MQRNKYQWLDLLRGASALLVCANHLRAAMFVDFATLAHSTLPVKLFYFLTGLGAQSVIVFFVLSGFFVGGSVLKRWNHFSFADYLLARLIRLWIVLVPALVLTFLLDYFSSRIAPDVFAGADVSTLNSGPDGNYSVSLATFVQNLLFLQTVSAPVFGSNSPLWSLSNEFWYYICFPLLFFIFDTKQKTRAMISATVIAALAFTMQDKALGLLVWLTGAATYCFLKKDRFTENQSITITLPLFFIALTLNKIRLLPANLDTIALGLSTGGLIVSLCAMPSMKRWLAIPTEWLARISYTLYLIHFPFVILLYVTNFRQQQALPGITNLIMFFGILLGLLLISHCFWLLFEKHTETTKTWLCSRLPWHRI